MARALTAPMIAALTAPSAQPVFFYEGIFVGFTLRLWSGLGDISWNGETWLGNGWFRGFQGVEEDNDLGSTGMEIALAGVPQSLISTILGAIQQNAAGKLWIGALDSSGNIIADPYLMFVGRLDVPTVDDQTSGPIIQISYESHLVDLDRSKEYRYTSESQRIFNATDRGFEYVAQIAKGWKGQWGATQKDIKKKEERETKKKRGGGNRGGKNRK